MAWIALELEVEGSAAESLADALLEGGAQSVCTEDADAGTTRESPLYREPPWERSSAWPRNRISALLAPGADAASVVAEAARSAGLGAPPAYRVRELAEADWVRRTQAQFPPLRVGERLWIVPSWCAPPPQPDALVVRLDPGVAFGTGSHPTTRLALRWLERTLRPADRVLDYGCGSGILALAAAKLGAAAVVAVDLDPQALEAAAANARANAVALQLADPEHLPAGDHDLIVANILARPLAGLVPIFAARTRVGARIALSGVLAAQAAELIAAYRPYFALRPGAREEGWALLEGTRR